MSSPGHTAGARGPRRWLAAPAPADRPAGRRGARGGLAIAATLMALAVLFARAFHTSGGGSGDRLEYDYVLDGPGWTGPTLLCAAGALVLGAVLLWGARKPATVGLAVALVPLGLGAGALAFAERQTAGRVSAAAAREARTLSTERGVRDALGTPAGRGSMRAPGLAAGCVVYAPERPEVDDIQGFCFRDGRVVGRFPEVVE